MTEQKQRAEGDQGQRHDRNPHNEGVGLRPSEQTEKDDRASARQAEAEVGEGEAAHGGFYEGILHKGSDSRSRPLWQPFRARPIGL